MPHDTAAVPSEAKRGAPSRGERWAGLALLARAAAPEKRELGRASGWLAAAGLLDAVGPILGKVFIDEHLLPARLRSTDGGVAAGRHARRRLAARVACATCSWCGWRRWRCARCGGCREWVYGHVLRLPMAFFDRAITGQLVSRITKRHQQIRQLYRKCCSSAQGLTVLAGAIVRHGLARLAADADRADADAGHRWHRLGLPALVGRAVRGSRRAAQRHQPPGQMPESIAGMGVLQAPARWTGSQRRFAGTNDGYYHSAHGASCAPTPGCCGRRSTWPEHHADRRGDRRLRTQSIGGLQVGLLYASSLHRAGGRAR